MLHNRLNQVFILYIENSYTKNINKEIILKQFADEHKYIIINIKKMLLIITLKFVWFC